MPVYFDLVDWLKLHRFARSTAEAEALILAGKVKNESHTIGIGKGIKLEKGSLVQGDVVKRLVPISRKEGLVVND